MDLHDYIRNVNGEDGRTLYRDITPLLHDPDAMSYALDQFVAHYRDANLGAIVGIESRGFIFAAPLADRLRLPFVPIRKPGKLPSGRISTEHALGDSRQFDIHADALDPGQRALIVDDVLATGSSARSAARLVELIGGEVAGFAFVIELTYLHGRRHLENYDVFALVTY